MMKYLFIICLFTCRLFSVFGQHEEPELHLKLLLLDDRFDELLQITDTLELADSMMDQIYFYRGRAYQSLLNYDSAYHYFHMAYQADSNNLSFRIAMGTMMYRLGRIREGIEIYEAIVAEFQPMDQHLAELANLYSIRKEYAKSLAIYKGLLEKDSLDAETAFFLGNACRGSKYEEDAVGYYKEAIGAYDMALEYDPDDNTIYFKIAQTYDRNLNQKKTAIEYYEKYLSGGSTDQELFNAAEGRSTALE